MGCLYYLARDDNRTLFELGKVLGSMREVLNLPDWDLADYSDERPPPKQLPELAELTQRLAAEFTGPHWRLPDAAEYADHLAKRLITWADGHPVVFTSESDHERLDAYEITGDRYLP